MPFVIPPPDSYVRFFDAEADPPAWRYIHLLEAEGPLRYPFRFPRLNPGAKQSDATIITEAKPKVFEPRGTNYLYLALLGLWPGFRYFIFHPYDRKRLLFDENITDISQDLTANLVYDDSPHDAPAYPLWISNKRYPAFQPQNIGPQAARAQIELQITKYRYFPHDRIPLEMRSALASGRIPSRPIIFAEEY